MRRLGVEHQIVQQSRLPGYETRHLPSRAHPNARDLVGIIARQGLEKVWLIIEKSVLEVNGERHRVQHEAARHGEVMHHLEYVVLIENVLGSAVVGDEAVLADMLRRAGVEVEIEGNGIELRIEVDAMIGKAKRRVELHSGALPVCESVEHVRRRRRLPECLEQFLDDSSLGTPHVLCPELHHIGDALENTQPFELAIQRQYWWTQPHTFPFSTAVKKVHRQLSSNGRF